MIGFCEFSVESVILALYTTDILIPTFTKKPEHGCALASLLCEKAASDGV